MLSEKQFQLPVYIDVSDNLKGDIEFDLNKSIRTKIIFVTLQWFEFIIHNIKLSKMETKYFSNYSVVS